MMRFPLLGLVLLGVVVPASAQHSLGSSVGRFMHRAASVAHAGHHAQRVAVTGFQPPRCHPAQRGRWETVQEQVMVPGYWQEQLVPPTYGWITQPCGHQVWGVVDAGGCRRVWISARWETRSRQVWVAC